MPFTSYEKARYIEMINEELDDITIDSPQENELVIQVLKTIIAPRLTSPSLQQKEDKSIIKPLRLGIDYLIKNLINFLYPFPEDDEEYIFPEKLEPSIPQQKSITLAEIRERVSVVEYYYKNPRKNVKKTEDNGEYQLLLKEYREILKGRIKAKIYELQSFTKDSQKEYTDMQRKRKQDNMATFLLLNKKAKTNYIPKEESAKVTEKLPDKIEQTNTANIEDNDSTQEIGLGLS